MPLLCIHLIQEYNPRESVSTHFRVGHQWAGKGYPKLFLLRLYPPSPHRSAEHMPASYPTLCGLPECPNIDLVGTRLPGRITSNNNLNIHSMHLAVDSMRHRDWIPMRSFQFYWPPPTEFGIFLSFLVTSLEEVDILSKFKGLAQWRMFSQTETPEVRQKRTPGGPWPSVSKSTNHGKKDQVGLWRSHNG